MKKKKESIFFITINTNQRAHTERLEDLWSSSLSAAMDKVFSFPQRYIDILEPEGSLSDVEKVKVTKRVEIAPETRTVHSHVMLRIFHRTKIHLNIAELKLDLMRELGLRNIYLWVKAATGIQTAMEEYINKSIFSK